MQSEKCEQPERVLLQVAVELHGGDEYVGPYDHDYDMGPLVLVVRESAIMRAIQDMVHGPVMKAPAPQTIYVRCPNEACCHIIPTDTLTVQTRSEATAVVYARQIVYCPHCHTWAAAGEQLRILAIGEQS